MKLGHHGSKVTSTSSTWTDKTKPHTAIAFEPADDSAAASFTIMNVGVAHRLTWRATGGTATTVNVLYRLMRKTAQTKAQPIITIPLVAASLKRASPRDPTSAPIPMAPISQPRSSSA